MKCEKCDREFASDMAYHQHMHDKHGVAMPSLREERLEKRREERSAEQTEKHKKERTKNIATVVIVLLIFAGAAAFILSSPSSSAQYNLAGIPEFPVHWHADVDVVICGEERDLPEAVAGGLLGSNRMHTHDRSNNVGSMPGSDGNGVVHTEGAIREAPEEHTLGRFLRNIGIQASNTSIMGFSNGDACGSAPGSVKVFVNDALSAEGMDYLPRDGDFIAVEFSASDEPTTMRNSSLASSTSSEVGAGHGG